MNQITNEDIKAYMPLVQKIVGGIHKGLPRSVRREDLMSAGMEGLWKGLLGMTHAENPEAYLRTRIQGTILDELRAQDWLPRRARAAMAEDAPNPIVRLQDMSDCDRNRALMAPHQEEDLEQAREVQILKGALARLPAREREICESYYIKGISFVNIARQMGVSDARISQLHSRALARIKELAA